MRKETVSIAKKFEALIEFLKVFLKENDTSTFCRPFEHDFSEGMAIRIPLVFPETEDDAELYSDKFSQLLKVIEDNFDYKIYSLSIQLNEYNRNLNHTLYSYQYIDGNEYRFNFNLNFHRSSSYFTCPITMNKIDHVLEFFGNRLKYEDRTLKGFEINGNGKCLIFQPYSTVDIIVPVKSIMSVTLIEK